MKHRSPWLDVCTPILLAGVAGGLTIAARDILAHEYLEHGMLRLALLATRDAVNLWLLAAAGSAVLVVAARFVLPRLWTTAFAGSVELRLLHPRVAGTRLAAALVGAAVWVVGAWTVNRFLLPTRFNRFHPVALAVDLALLVVAAWASWRLSRMDLARVVPVFRSVLRPTTAGLLVGIGALNGLVLWIDNRPGPARPNVVLVVVDTLRADHVGRVGATQALTPNLDRLAAHGWLFRRATSPSSWTTPAVASILTSQYPRVLGITANATAVGRRFSTLAEIFREAGYSTGAIVSHTFVSARLGLGQGFDLYDEECSGGHGSVSSPSLTDKALAFVHACRKRPFFLFVHYFDPHYDFIHHEGHGSVPSSDGMISSGEPIQSLRLKARYFSAEDRDFVRALYGSEVSFTDHHLGRLLQDLERAGLYDETIVVVTADHGEEFCERGDAWIGHTRTLYQELIHVPLIVKPAGTRQSRTFDRFVGLIDVAPTILDLAGVVTPRASRFEGSTLCRLTETDATARPIFSATRRVDHLQSVILSGKKLIHHPVPDVYELYDLVADPLESLDLAGDDPETLALLARILHDWDEYVEHRCRGAVVERPELTDEQERMLRSLGYL